MTDKYKNILIIGGAGFIGSHLIEILLKKTSSRIIIFDNFVRGTKKNIEKSLLNKRVKLYEKGSDICHYEILDSVIKEENIDVIFHFAALWLLHCQEFPKTAFEVNIKGTFNILEACRNNKVKKLIFSSSASVYGDNQYDLIDESHPQHSKNFYGATKISCEAMIRAYHHKYNMNIIGLRYMNVYGPRQDYKGAYIAVIMKMLDSIDNNKGVTIFGNGDESYDFVSVKDCANSNFKALISSVPFGFFNIGSGIKTSLKKLAEILIDLKKVNTKISYKKDFDKTLVKNRVADISLAKKYLKYSPKVKLEEGLKELIKWRDEDKNNLQFKK